MIVKNFNGKEIKFKEFAVPESSNAKRNISTKIIKINQKLGEKIFKEKIIKRLDLPDDDANFNYDKFWSEDHHVPDDNAIFKYDKFRNKNYHVDSLYDFALG